MYQADTGLIDPQNISFLDDLAPAHCLRLEEFGELFGRARNRLEFDVSFRQDCVAGKNFAGGEAGGQTSPSPPGCGVVGSV